jgi:hypothetical protein
VAEEVLDEAPTGVAVPQLDREADGVLVPDVAAALLVGEPDAVVEALADAPLLYVPADGAAVSETVPAASELAA